MNVLIRQFRPGDAAALAALMHASVHANGARDYTPAQLHAWSPRAMAPDVFLARVSDGRDVWVARNGSALSGFIELEANGHIDCFYCHPAGAGIGSALYQTAEAKAAACGLAQLSVEASEAARRFFLRVGFQGARRRIIWRRGEVLHNYAMKKMLHRAGHGTDPSHS